MKDAADYLVHVKALIAVIGMTPSIGSGQAPSKECILSILVLSVAEGVRIGLTCSVEA